MNLLENDIIHTINNNLINENTQLLINIIIENISNNEKFKEVFIKIYGKDVDILNKKPK